MRRPTVVRVLWHAWPVGGAGEHDGAGFKVMHRGHWAGPWRPTRALAEADAAAWELVPRGRAFPLTGR